MCLSDVLSMLAAALPSPPVFLLPVLCAGHSG
jgi:hypothetical protein